MSVKVYGCNDIAIEIDDVEKAAAFYHDVFDLERRASVSRDESLVWRLPYQEVQKAGLALR